MKNVWKNRIALGVLLWAVAGVAGSSFADELYTQVAQLEESVIYQNATDGTDNEENDRIRDFGATAQQGWRQVLFETLDRVFNPPSWFDGSGLRTSTTPSILLRSSYYDALPVVGEADVEFRVAPALAALFESSRNKLFLRGKWDIYRYLEYDTLNEEGQNYQAVFDTKFSERVNFEIDGAFRQSSTLRSELADTGEDFIPEYGLSDFTKYYVTPLLTLRSDARNTFEIKYSYQDANYEEELLYDYAYHQTSLTWLNLYTERTGLYFDLGGDLLDSDLKENGTGSEYTLRALGGFQYRLSKKQTWGFRGGVRYTSSTFDSMPDDMTESDWGFVALANLLWRFDENRTFLKLVYTRNQVPSSKGEFQDVDKVEFEFLRRLTERFSFMLDGYWRRTKTKGYVEEIETDKFRIQPRLTYRPFKHMRIELLYRYYWANDLIYDVSTDRNQVFLQFVGNWPKTW